MTKSVIRYWVTTLFAGVCIIFLFFKSCTSIKADYPAFEWHEEELLRWAELPLIETNRTGFEKIPGSTSGIEFKNLISEDLIIENRNLLNGSGVAVGDITGNGFPDIYFCRIDGPNLLYENHGGFRFTDITEKAGVALDDQYSTGALIADLNGNNLLDLVVTAIGSPNRIFFNNGNSTFSEAENGLPSNGVFGSTSIAAGDITGNGAVDLYITNYKKRSVRDIYPDENEFRHIVQQIGEDEFELRSKFKDHYNLVWRDQFLLWFETGEEDLLYLNDGTGQFEQADLSSGILFDENGKPITEPLKDWGLHAKMYDINQNGLQDIYVANDFESPDRIWLNQGDGTFKALPSLAKRKSSLSSMAVDFSDINRNGFTDFFVIEMLSRSHSLRHKQMSTMAPSTQVPGAIDNRPQYLGNTLFLNRGDQTWAEISEYSGVRRSDWSWSAHFLDVTLNGYEDILISNGHYLDVQDSDANLAIRSQINSGRMDMNRTMLFYSNLPNQNVAFRNEGNLKFTDVSSDWGFTDFDISHGMAIADLNNNGYPDVVMNRLDDEAAIYRNLADKSRIIVRLAGEAPNTQGSGAKIILEGGPVTQSKSVALSGGYLSSSVPAYIFAAGDHAEHVLTVEWPEGKVSKIEGIQANRIYEISQENAANIEVSSEETTEELTTIFSDISERLDHHHTYNRFDDIERQPLLYKRLDRTGPSVSLIDTDGNGVDDIVISGSEGSMPGIFKSQGDEHFVKENLSNTEEFSDRDQSASIGWRDHEGRFHLIVGFSRYIPSEQEVPAARYLVIENGEIEIKQDFEQFGSSAGSLSMADYSGNGYPDLFISGRVKPGRYPEPASSRLYINEGNIFRPDEINNSLFEDIGLISGSVFSDLTGDGRPELLLAEKWGTIRVFKNADEQFEEITEPLGFDSYRGWWNGVATGDFTGNGRMDIVASNWGENHPYVYRNEGLNTIFYSDINQDGHIDIIESYYDDDVKGMVPRRGLPFLAQYPPFIGNNVSSFHEYSESTLETILGHSLQRYQRVEAGFYQHVIFIQKSDGTFEVKPLPQETQFAPAFEPVIADFDGDGHMDLFLSQNYFSYRDELPRSDAGRGLLLTGDGAGNFEPLPGNHSGILIYGEQRGAAVGDLNRNGRPDLVVGQFANKTKVYVNETAVPALRVRVVGDERNPAAIGAKLNLRYTNGSRGAVKEIQAGSGYRAQHSFVQLLSNHEMVEAVEVYWPDGTKSDIPVHADDSEIEILYNSE